MKQQSIGTINFSLKYNGSTLGSKRQLMKHINNITQQP